MGENIASDLNPNLWVMDSLLAQRISLEFIDGSSGWLRTVSGDSQKIYDISFVTFYDRGWDV